MIFPGIKEKKSEQAKGKKKIRARERESEKERKKGKVEIPRKRSTHNKKIMNPTKLLFIAYRN